MSDDELARFLASRNPDVVLREWTSANLEDAKREGISEGIREKLLRAERRRELKLASDEFDKAQKGLGCIHGHQASDMRYRTTKNGRVARWCLACKREQARSNYQYKKARERRAT